MQTKEHVKESERLNASVLLSLSIMDHLEGALSSSLTELSEALGIHKSRVMRLCGTLEQMGYVIRRHEDGRYVLGPRLLSLGKAFERQNPLMSLLRPVLEKLSRELNENVLFQVLHGNRRLCVCSICRPDLRRYVTPEGSETSICYGASSRVFLTWGPPELRAEVLADAPYRRYTEHTITTAEALQTEIEKTLALGYSVSREERTYGTAALAIPLFGQAGALQGSLSIASITDRFNDALIERALPLMREAARYLQAMTAGTAKFTPRMPRRDDQ